MKTMSKLAVALAWAAIAMFIIVLAAMVVIVGFISTPARAATATETWPQSISSLQPFQKFGKGEGEGVAISYYPRSKAQLVALFRDRKAAKEEMRAGVTCDVLVRQMAEAHPGLPFEGCEGFAAAIEHDSDFAVVACEDKMFTTNNWLTVTDPKGTKWGVWHRKCLPNEKVLAYKGQPLISTTCLNVAIPLVPVPSPTVAAAPAPVVSTPPPVRVALPEKCQAGRSIVATAVVRSRLPEALRGKVDSLIAAAKLRDTRRATNPDGYRGDDVSRTLWKEIRTEVSARIEGPLELEVRFRHPSNLLVMRALKLPMVNGDGSVQLPVDPREWIVEVLWPTHFISPTISGDAVRLWILPEEWGKVCRGFIAGVVD